MDEKTSRQHPLTRLQPHEVYYSTHEFISKWRVNTSTEKAFSMLQVIQENWIDDVSMVIELLRAADDYKYGMVLSLEADDEKLGYGRALVARKALKVLCTRFFKDEKWRWAVKHETVCDEIARFLCDETREAREWRFRNCPNISSSNKFEDVVLHKFIREFMFLLWPMSDGPVGHLPPPHLMKIRPQFAEILGEVKELHNLFGRNDLDEETLKRLEEVALRYGMYNLPRDLFGQHISDSRKPRSVEQAAVGGSLEAMIVIVNRVCKAERFRMEEQYRVSRDLHFSTRMTGNLTARRLSGQS